jgi:hypothetical protein
LVHIVIPLVWHTQDLASQHYTVVANRVCCRNNTSEIESFPTCAWLRDIVAIAAQQDVESCPHTIGQQKSRVANAALLQR